MRRFLFRGNPNDLPQQTCDVVIIGTGLAGIYTALHLNPLLRVILINKGSPLESNSRYAQGGIAAAVAPGDSPDQHFADSWAAGAAQNDPAALNVLVSEGPENVRLLRDWGVPFDLDDAGCLAVSREGAHHRDRIVHCRGDSTGLHVTKTLLERLSRSDNCRIQDRTCLVDFQTDASRSVCGVITLSADHPDRFAVIRARHIVLATGGIGGLFPRTTNAVTATGDGLAAALRCGAAVRDLEFIQFHPTALPWPDESGRCFLISEAVRGEGAILRNEQGHPFMADEHPMADLAPRDIVSRAIFKQMQAQNTEHVWLDITHRDPVFLRQRFPTIYKTCADKGYDMAEQWQPVAPVQHYYMGGIRTDLDGRTSLTGLSACGEAACTGIYGANRLASNSLLECLVFGRRIARAINAAPNEFVSNSGQPDSSGLIRIVKGQKALAVERVETIRSMVRQTMERHCGILRCREGLTAAVGLLDDLDDELSKNPVHDRFTMETCQMVLSARAIVRAALDRPCSIGAHFLTDDPTTGLHSVI